MARQCAVCRHPDRAAIEAALVDGASYRDVARRWGMHHSTVHRHKRHMVEAIAAAVTERQAVEVQHAHGVLDRLQRLQWVAQKVLGEALRRKDRRTALAAVGRVRELLALEAELTGQLRRGVSVDVAVVLRSPEWARVRQAIVDALAPYPEARDAVVRALEALD